MFNFFKKEKETLEYQQILKIIKEAKSFEAVDEITECVLEFNNLKMSKNKVFFDETAVNIIMDGKHVHNITLKERRELTAFFDKIIFSEPLKLK